MDVSIGPFGCKIFTKNSIFVVEVKEEFSNSKLESVEMHPGEWMTELESLCN